MEPRFSAPVIVNSFFDPKNPKKIAPELRKFSRAVSRIAVLDFGEKELRAHYETDFFRATITYIYLGREEVAFFIAVFKKKEDANRNRIYEGSGFPGIKYKYRGGNKIDFKKIMSKLSLDYVKYYYTEILKPNTVQPILDAFKGANKFLSSSKTPFEKLSEIGFSLSSLLKFGKRDKLIIVATAENPIMYATLMGMNLKFSGNDPKPTDAELSVIKSWNTEQLLVESYKQSLLPPAAQHSCLYQPPFVVNLPANEWRRFFKGAGIRKDEKSSFLKYFLWKNYNFPDTAFRFHFEVNPVNIVKAMIAMYL